MTVLRDGDHSLQADGVLVHGVHHGLEVGTDVVLDLEGNRTFQILG